MEKKKVLIFTYYWPPAGGPGVQRFLKFSKFLPEFGWEPVVVTVKDGSYPYIDKSLENDIPEGMEIHKTDTFEVFKLFNMLRGKKGKSVGVGGLDIKGDSLFKRFSRYVRANYFVPDARVGWKKYAIQKGRELIAKGDIHAIITTGPPHSTHLTGLALKKETGIPWLADLRDPWSGYFMHEFLPRTEKTIRKEEQMEATVLKTADCTTTVSDRIKEKLAKQAKRAETIFNGYDESDFDSLPVNNNSIFRLEYIGNLKPNQDVQALWKAIADMAKASEEFKAKFRLELTGKVAPDIMESIRAAGIEDQTITNGFVNHQEAVRKMSAASVLLFIIPNTKDNKGILTGKIFEYMASRTPMLSIGPVDGDASKTLDEGGRDKMMDYEDAEQIKTALKSFWEEWLMNNGNLDRVQGDHHKQFSRKALTEKLAKILNEISST